MRPVLCDGLLEVVELLAGEEADLLQRREMLLGLSQVVGHEVRVTDVLVGATMAGIELQGALMIREGERELADGAADHRSRQHRGEDRQSAAPGAGRP